MTIKDIKYLFILLAGCLFCCTETSDGCLDTTARNFDVTADNDCCLDVSVEECCCIYPDLEIDVSYKQREADTLEAAATNFDLETFYALENGQDSIRIDSFYLFINQLKPVNQTLSDSICVIETINFTQENANGDILSFSIEDNIALIDALQFRFELGTYQSNLDIEEVNLTLGLPVDVAQIDPENIINDNNLRNSFDFLFNEERGSFPSMSVNFTIKRGEEQRVISRELFFDERVTFRLTSLFINDKGADLVIQLRINVLDIFKGIIFDVANEEIDIIIEENLASSIFILE